MQNLKTHQHHLYIHLSIDLNSFKFFHLVSSSFLWTMFYKQKNNQTTCVWVYIHVCICFSSPLNGKVKECALSSSFNLVLVLYCKVYSLGRCDTPNPARNYSSSWDSLHASRCITMKGNKAKGTINANFAWKPTTLGCDSIWFVWKWFTRN